MKANSFANTYGYPKISYTRGVDTSADLESSVRAMLERHNTFARGVRIPDSEELELIKSIIGQDASMDDMLKYVSTHGRPEDPRKRIFISGTTNALAYSGFPNDGRTALILRKYNLGSDRNKWFDEADFKIYSLPESDNIATLILEHLGLRVNLKHLKQNYLVKTGNSYLKVGHSQSFEQSKILREIDTGGYKNNFLRTNYLKI